MKKVVILILFLGFLLLFFGKKIIQPQGSKPFVLENLCPPEESSPSASLNLLPLIEPLDGWRIHKNLKYNFIFQSPENQWYVHPKIIQEYEEPLTSSQAEYSLYFSHPVDNINPYHWEIDQRATLRFLVFKNYCQSLNNWIEIIPESSKAEKEDCVVDGRPGIRLKHLRGYKDNEIMIFNKGDYLYEFQLLVKNK